MDALANLKLRWKLIAITVIPILSLIYYALNEVARDNTILTETEEILQLSQFSVGASTLVHEFQKERGLTAGFMGSKGQKFSAELLAQRQEVDKKAKTLATILSKLESRVFGEDFVKQLNSALAMQKKLQQIRLGVDDFSIPRGEAIGYFSKMNGAFLGAISFLAKSTSEGELSNQASAYVNFLNSKERAGIERAVLTGTFAADAFQPGAFNRFLQLVSIQDTYLNVFDSLATHEHKEFYLKTMKGESIVATKEMRAIAIAKGTEGGFGVDAGHWFQMQTSKINLLKKVEDKLSMDLEASAKDLLDYASTALYLSVAIMLAALILTALFLYQIQKVIIHSISTAVDVADAIAAGNLDNVIDVNTTDEAGQLLNSLKSMQQSLAEQREKERLQAEKDRVQAEKDRLQAEKDREAAEQERKRGEANSRIRQALDTVSASVILANEQAEIIYINTTAEKMLSEKQSEIAQQLPNFSVDKLSGSNLDVFEHVAEFSKGALSELVATKEIEIMLAKFVFKVVLSPVVSSDGKRLGTVVEWLDLTEQRDAERQVEKVINAAAAGQLSARLDSERFNGFMNSLANGVNQLLDAIVGPINVAANYVERISRGDVPEKITDDYEGDFSKLKDNLNTCIEAINLLVQDSDLLVKASVEGRLSVRADANQHQGDFKKIIEGVNDSLDAIVNPLTVAADYVDSIAKGDIPEPITQEYRGDFNKLKNNLNKCIGAVNRLIHDANSLASAAVEGALTTRADVAEHEGDFRKIVEGVNNTLDAIVSPVNETKDVMSALADGDLTKKMSSNYRGDFSVLSDAVNTSIHNLQQLVSKVVDSAENISKSSQEISSGVMNLSQRTEQQASSLEETASSMEEMTSTVKQNAENSHIANDLAIEAQKRAAVGGEVVGGAERSMAEINASSKKISDIIIVIDEIAFQTNLLALNAAVEAARAGEMGRGFAVVAAEVRQLAQRSAEAAKEIKDLIRDSVGKVEEGSEQVSRSGETLTEIVASVEKVTDMISNISTASSEQSSGIEQVNKAITQMDEMTQQNAALVEEASATSESMAELARAMIRLLSAFKINAEETYEYQPQEQPLGLELK